MKYSSIVTMTLLSVLTILSSIASANDQVWFLMSRHGECAEMSALKRKFPDMGNIKGPQAFIAFVEGKGHKIIAKDLYANEQKELQGLAFDVNVPSEGLSLMFVKGVMCKEFIGRIKHAESTTHY